MLFVAIRYPFYEGKTASLEKIVQFENGEQKAVRSSTNSSTQTRQTSTLVTEL
jgi:hypothetical protein